MMDSNRAADAKESSSPATCCVLLLPREPILEAVSTAGAPARVQQPCGNGGGQHTCADSRLMTTENKGRIEPVGEPKLSILV